jgi:hypothetical protein
MVWVSLSWARGQHRSRPHCQTRLRIRWSFWIPAALCGFSLAVNIIYVFWERTVVPKRYRLTGTRAAALAKNQRRPDFRSLLLLPW